jgi:hypothetical protein
MHLLNVYISAADAGFARARCVFSQSSKFDDDDTIIQCLWTAVHQMHFRFYALSLASTAHTRTHTRANPQWQIFCRFTPVSHTHICAAASTQAHSR